MTAATYSPDSPPPVGSFFLRHIPNLGGRWIAGMQAFVRGGSFWTHAGLVLSRGQFIQGQPGGADIYPIGDLFDGAPLLVSDAPIQKYLEPAGALRGAVPEKYLAAPGPLGEDEIRARVDVCGRALLGTPYSFLDYLAIGAVEFNWPGSRRLRHYVEDSGHLICSALVDRAFSNAGVRVFDDKPYRWDPNQTRLPGDVTPEDLSRLAQSFPASMPFIVGAA